MVLPSTGSIRLATVCLVEIHGNNGFEARPKVKENYKNFQGVQPYIWDSCKETAQQIRDDSCPHYHISRQGSG